MNAKERFYSGLAKETIGKITSNTDNWTSFLRTMSRNYEFTYPEQVMIYAQRPNATFCKPYEDWNAENYRRYVKRGSTGIALFVMNRDKPYLRYVFDVADTGVRRSSPELKPWEVTPENRSYVMEAMERTFGVAADGVLEAQLEDIASALAAEYWDDYKKQLLDIVANSFLEEYDELNIEVAFKNAVANSVSYTMYCRFVESPDNYFEHEDFQKVFDFNTRQTVNALGTAVNAISTRMFQEIEKAIGEHEQIKAAEPDKIKEMVKWNKKFTEPITDDDVITLLRLSAAIDELWEAQIRLRKEVGAKTQDVLSIFGHTDDAVDSHTTIRQKDKIYSELYKSEHMRNAGPYARLKFAMDYWCALWFWPIDKADLLPTRSEFLFDMSLILEGTMASIVKRKKKYSVVYTYTDEAGNKRQKWETFDTNAEAKKRKLQVEYEQEAGTFIPPSAKTVNDLLEEYMSIYGVNTWAMSTYESRKSLISNYVRPLIGDMKLEDVTPRIMDKYYRDLLSVKAVSTKYVKARHEFLTPHTVREIHKVLRNAFNQAVKWELMTRNPVEHATLPKEEHKAREIWTAEVLLKALEVCDDDILRLAINLAFSCSLRMGELLGLTWDCVDISPASIELGQASIFVEKELQRVNREAMADLNGKDIMFKFPPTFASTHTALVLKTPKTKTSVRKVFLPKTVAEMLVQRKADIEELKELFGDEFLDFNLVFCSSNGKPIEGQVINRAFNKLIEEHGLPKVVFHSLRHSSITYKLKLNGGDMKSVQGDSGHAQVKMVADVYSHIIDDDRRLNAERLEAAFYSGRITTPEPVQPVPEATQDGDAALLMKLLQNPEMAALLKSLAKTL